MRILRIADVLDNRTGGMSRAMYGTGGVLVEEGHQVDYLFSNQFRSQSPANLRRFTNPVQVTALVRRLRTQGRNYEVVEIHEPIAADYCFRRQFDKSLPPAAVFSHGLEERGLRAEIEYRTQKGLPVTLKKRYSPLSVVLQAQYAVRHSSQVICTNLADITYLASMNVSEERLSLVHNGIENSLLEAGKNPLNPAERSGLLFVGSWLVRKGILDLVPAVSAVLRRHPQLVLTVAGSGVEPEVVRGNFPKEVRGQVNVIPKFSGNQALADLYRRHSVFILPSYFEGQPLVMFEAAAFGMAIVTTNVCGMLDFVEEGVNGFLISPGDAQALEKRLMELMDNPERVQQVGTEARATAEQHTWTHSARSLLQAYERAISVAQAEAR